jgi:hypothetical protein
VSDCGPPIDTAQIVAAPEQPPPLKPPKVVVGAGAAST